MTHTPGPWEIRRVGIAKDLPVVTSAEHDVCEMRYNTNGRLRLENNARLRAAAPELLAALKAARKTMALALDNMPWLTQRIIGTSVTELTPEAQAWCDTLNAAAKEARAAIARAE